MLEIIYKKITEIQPYENNPRDNRKAVEPVAESIREFGFRVPIIIEALDLLNVDYEKVAEGCHFYGEKNW
jgi:ParB-like chromosome segregation protein Spo0J